VASTCHHSRARLPAAVWFARFCGLGPAAVSPRQPQQQQPQQPQQRQQQHQQQQEAVLSGGGACPTVVQAQCSSSSSSSSAGSGAGGGPTSQAHPPPTAAEAELLLGSDAALHFWVFCVCQLAYPCSVTALFAEEGGEVPLVRSAFVLEALKAAFRCGSVLVWPDEHRFRVCAVGHSDSAASPLP
jgi:hypothetical protein